MKKLLASSLGLASVLSAGLGLVGAVVMWRLMPEPLRRGRARVIEVFESSDVKGTEGPEASSR